MAWCVALQPGDVPAVRAAYAALFLGLAGGLAVATAVLSGPTGRPPTVAGVLGLDGPERPDLASRREEAVAALIAECMANHGLDWTPVVEPPPALPDPDLDPVAWADRWGFGLATMVGRPGPPGQADPNLEALGHMTVVERARYLAVLDGPGAAGDGGCRGAANSAVFGLRERHLSPLRGDLDALHRAIAADPGMGAAAIAWQRCVSPVAGGHAKDRATLVPAMMRELDARIQAAGSDAAALTGIAADERLQAGVVARCEGTFAADRAMVAAAHEARFIARHEQALLHAGAAIRGAEADLPTLPPRTAAGRSAGSQSIAGP